MTREEAAPTFETWRRRLEAALSIFVPAPANLRSSRVCGVSVRELFEFRSGLISIYNSLRIPRCERASAFQG
jgi:hypothetical protein